MREGGSQPGRPDLRGTGDVADGLVETGAKSILVGAGCVIVAILVGLWGFVIFQLLTDRDPQAGLQWLGALIALVPVSVFVLSLSAFVIRLIARRLKWF